MFYCLLHEYRIYTYFSLLTIQRSLRSTLFPYTTLFRSVGAQEVDRLLPDPAAVVRRGRDGIKAAPTAPKGDRKSTRLNSSHVAISYAVFCLKKKTYTSILWKLLVNISQY